MAQISDISQRQRGPSNGPSSGARPQMDNRNGSGASAGINRAEKFENEKKRIIESCFTKKDVDGCFNESYITHLRIVEDAAYPSAPPPPDSSPDNKKPRLIVVAVRKTGRVRMHKVRENPNGTFSIGKTWHLDDLTCIDSFAGPAPTDPEELKRRQWARGVGFVVTLQKHYYWEAATPKEKDFFISSLTKIYKKYTGGKLPNLKGFEPRMLEQIMAPYGQQLRVNSESSSYPMGQLGVDGVAESRQDEPPQSKSETYERTQRQQGFFPGSDFTKPAPGPQTQQRPARDGSPNASTGQAGVVKNQNFSQNEPGSRRLAGAQSVEFIRHGNKPFDSKLVSSISTDQLRSNRAAPIDSRFLSNGSQRSGSPINQFNHPIPRGGTPPLPESHQDIIPERRRPPLGNATNGSGLRENFTAPLASPGLRREDIRPPSRSRDRPTATTLNSPSVPGSAAQPLHQRPQEINTPSTAPAVTMDSAGLDAATTQSNIPLSEVSTPTTTATPPPKSPTPSEEEKHRPGLGPMIKKKSSKNIADSIRKAAAAYTAFKPRLGGAGDKLREESDKKVSGPDGITSVVPAPSLLRPTKEPMAKTSALEEKAEGKQPSLEAKSEIPTVKVTEAIKETTGSELQKSTAKAPETPWSKADKAQELKAKRRSAQTVKIAAALGVDLTLFSGATLAFEDALDEFGWGSADSSSKKADILQADVRSEIDRLEAGSWLSHYLEQQDERVETVNRMLSKAIAECDAMDGLLSIYNVELGTLDEDVAYIEAQSQGLQVQAANQKLLQRELQSLLKTISISPSQLQVLREASLATAEGLKSAEESLGLLYKAMLRIDPRLRQSDARPDTSEDINYDRNSISGFPSGGITSMKAIQEKKIAYQRESILFLQRMKQYMKMIFALAEQKVSDALETERKNDPTRQITKLDPKIHDPFRKEVWNYRQLMLFAREVEPFEWDEMMRLYEQSVRRPFQEEMRDNAMAWKMVTRKPTGDEQDLLFTNQEKETDSLASTARKLTVKRGKTLRSIPGSPNRTSFGDKPKDGKMYAYEAISGALDEMVPLVFQEQNFIVEFFHASSLENADFLDTVTNVPVESRSPPSLTEKKLFDPDRAMGKKITQMMEEIFSTWPADLQDLVDWATKTDPLQAIGILHTLDLKLQGLGDTNQEYLARTLQKVRYQVSGYFSRFVDEQVRGIEETKVKIKKRKGVISFIKTFPNFTAAIESMIPEPTSSIPLEVRFTINEAYQKINKAMFESLNFIAKETPTVMLGSGGQQGQGQGQSQAQGIADPEDKEALNYHILLIENMNHYLEEVDARHNIVLQEWRDKASVEMSEHMNLYLAAVIRRPLSKLLDFLESTESLLLTAPTPTSIATRASHSRSTFKKILGNYDAKEMRRGIEALRKRVDKHFGEADDLNLSRRLVGKVLRQCEALYVEIGARTRKVVDGVYEGSLEVEWRREDVVAAFRR